MESNQTDAIAELIRPERARIYVQTPVVENVVQSFSGRAPVGCPNPEALSNNFPPGKCMGLTLASAKVEIRTFADVASVSSGPVVVLIDPVPTAETGALSDTTVVSAYSPTGCDSFSDAASFPNKTAPRI